MSRASNQARIEAVIGASGTGKGVWIKGRLKTENPSRLIIWDFMDEYGKFARPCTDLNKLTEAMRKAGGDGPLKARYLPQKSDEKGLRNEFMKLCDLVYGWESCSLIVEELSNVTTASWAPPSWRKMTTSGRHANIHIVGTTQNPAIIDKTFLSNCTLIHVTGLRVNLHRRAVAQSTDIPESDIASLVPLEYIEKDFMAGEIRRGNVKIPRS